MARAATLSSHSYTKSSILTALNGVKAGISTSEVIELSSSYIFTGDYLTTYNDRNCVSYPFKTKFSCAVPSKDFYNIIKGIRDKDISLVLGKDESLKISSRGSEAEIATQVFEGSELEKLIQSLGLAELEFTDAPEGLAKGLDACRFSASKKVSADNIYCIFINGKTIYSSDNARITRYELDTELPRVLIPASSVNELVKFKIVGYNINVEEGWAHFLTEDQAIFSCRIVDGDYEDFSDHFDSFRGTKFKAPSSTEFRQVLKDVSPLCKGEDDLSKYVEITLKPGKDTEDSKKTVEVTVFAEKETGHFKTTIEVEIEREIGEEIMFRINPIFFGQILSKTSHMAVDEGLALFKTKHFEHLVSLPVEGEEEEEDDEYEDVEPEEEDTEEEYDDEDDE